MSDAKEWQHAKDFQEANVIVRVTRLVQHRSRYSLTVIRATDDGKTQRHFGVFMDFANGGATLRQTLAATVAKLWAQAEEWIALEVNKREAEIAAGL